jgi:phosphodiesterase/alkaline phosphatase D-like protein
MAGPSRRDFVRLVGAGAAGLALGCGDNLTTTAAASAILEPTSDALIVAVWARSGRTATVELRTGDGLVTAEVELGSSGSGAIDLVGLEPATTYELTIVTASGIRLGPHLARTAPRDDDPRAVRIAVVADVDANPAFDSDLVSHVVDADPDLVVSLGDFPYTDNGPVAQTLAEYRDRHAEIRTLPRIRTLLESASLRAIYDDHEFRNNWDAAFAASETSRLDAALTVWDEFFPLRDPVGEVRYRRWRWGANVECFLLDCRRFRSANAAPDDAQKTMLGATQRAWFQGAIAASTARFKLVFTSVPLGYGTGDDHWTTFATERNAILDALVGIPGILFVTADQHFFAAHRHAYGIRELQVGPLARGLGTPGPMEPGVLFRSVRYNAGLFEIDAERLVVTAIGPDGERFYRETLTADELTPRRS